MTVLTWIIAIILGLLLIIVAFHSWRIKALENTQDILLIDRKQHLSSELVKERTVETENERLKDVVADLQDQVRFWQDKAGGIPDYRKRPPKFADGGIVSAKIKSKDVRL